MKRIVCSGNYSYIYHGLNLGQLSAVLNSDKLEARHHFAVCLTRSLDFAKSFLRKSSYTDISKVRCVLVLDKCKLSDNYKIVPVSDYANMLETTDTESDCSEYQKNTKARMKSRYRGHSFNKAEERCYVPILHLNRYIIKILIDSSIAEFDEYYDVIESIQNDGYSVEMF